MKLVIFTSEIVVRYAETDQMGIAHHSVYPIWFEVARTNYIKNFGMTYSQMEQAGVMMPVINVNCHYCLPAKYEDVLQIETSALQLTNAKMTFKYTVKRKTDGVILGYGTTEHGFVDSKTFHPVSIKKRLPQLYAKIIETIK